jgi:hypothetical protein
MSTLPLIVDCDDVIDFIKKVELFGRRKWIYRGHARYSETIDKDWLLKSSLHRFLNTHRGKAIRKSSWYPRERSLIARFQGAAHLYISNIPSIKEKISWLALMQHYGSHTRLLDFTFSPVIALYFAIREASPDTGKYSVHAIHIDSVRDKSLNIRKTLPTYDGKSPELNPAIDEYNIGYRPHSVDFLGIYDGRLLNQRQEAQEGVFLVPNKIDLDIEGWLRDCKPKGYIRPHRVPWVEFVFRNSEDQYYKSINQLLNIGMTPKRLFPGLEGLSESMKYLWLEVAKEFEPSGAP